jgi:hypothetical protein
MRVGASIRDPGVGRGLRCGNSHSDLGERKECDDSKQHGDWRLEEGWCVREVLLGAGLGTLDARDGRSEKWKCSSCSGIWGYDCVIEMEVMEKLRSLLQVNGETFYTC